MNLNETVIEQAKNYAKNNSVRLSKLIESYLASLTTSEKKLKPKVSPLVESLTGVIPEKNSSDHKSSYRNYLSEKYF